MIDFKQYHDVINERITAEGAFYYADLWWEKEIQVFCADIQKSILFVKKEMTDDEYYWLSEIIDDILLRTKSNDLLIALKERLKTVADEAKKAEIEDCINEAITISDL